MYTCYKSCTRMTFQWIDEAKWKGWQLLWLEPRTPLAWAASALLLSHVSQTTTKPHNPLYATEAFHYMHIRLMHNSFFTHTSTWHSALLTPQPSVYKEIHIFHVQQHNNITHTPTCHTDSALIMHFTASAYKTDLSAMLSSYEVAVTHNITYFLCTTTFRCKGGDMHLFLFINFFCYLYSY